MRLSDEVLHVVSGFQVAGFRQVVGCLWPSDDNVCVEVAVHTSTPLSTNQKFHGSLPFHYILRTNTDIVSLSPEVPHIYSEDMV